jgi:hypothetical protein
MRNRVSAAVDSVGIGSPTTKITQLDAAQMALQRAGKAKELSGISIRYSACKSLNDRPNKFHVAVMLRAGRS